MQISKIKKLNQSVATLIATSTIMVSSMQFIHAEDIQTFGFIGYDGYIDFRYLQDDQSTVQTAPVRRREERKAYQEEFHVTTHSYIYHPKFLTMDIGGGIVFVQNDIVVDAINSSNVQTYNSNGYSDTLVDYSVKLNFLTEKEYPFSLYYDRSNPLVSPSLDEQFLQENTRYGANFTWRTPVVYTFQTSVYESKGVGFNLIVDEEIKQSNLRAYYSLGADGYTQGLYQKNEIVSKSGNLDLAITPTKRESELANFDMRYAFGGKKQYEIVGLMSHLTQNPSPNLTETRISPEFRWKHSKTVKSFYKANYVKSEQDTNTTTASQLTTGVSEQNKVGFSQQYGAHLDKTKTSSTDETTDGVSTHLGYALPFKDGGLNLGASFSYDKRNQVATKTFVPVFNEHHVLNSTVSIDLKNKFISNLSTIEIYNASRSQRYSLGNDYELLTIGSVTQVRRLAGGSILDGQEVVIDYEYTSGGTFKSILYNQDYQITLNFLKYYNTFARYRDVEHDLEEGSTNRLNSSETTSYGGGVNFPISTWANIAADTLYEDHVEVISSYDRTSTKFSLQFNLPLSTVLDFTNRRTVINQKTSDEDVDLTRNSVRLRMRPFLRSSLTYTYSEEEDVGGTKNRELNEHSLEFEWRYRAITMRLDGRFVDEKQGNFARERESIHLSIRRDF